MKRLALAFALVALSSEAFAVTVANCPATVFVTLTGPRVLKTLAQVRRELNEGFFEEEPEVVAAVAASLRNLETTRQIRKGLFLRSARSGKCVYANRVLNEKVEIYTTRGQDVLYLQTPAGPRGTLARAYGVVTAFGKTAVRVNPRSVRLALAIPRSHYDDYSAGGPLITIGGAESLAVDVLR